MLRSCGHNMPENIAIMLQSNQTSEGKEKYARVRFHTIQKSQQSEREKNMEELTTHLAFISSIVTTMRILRANVSSSRLFVKRAA